MSEDGSLNQAKFLKGVFKFGLSDIIIECVLPLLGEYYPQLIYNV